MRLPRFQHYIDGAFEDGAASFESLNPATGRRIRAEVVWVNTYRAVSPIAPFGGFGLSGLGREGGLEAVLDYTRVKTVWLRTSDEPISDPFVMR